MGWFSKKLQTVEELDEELGREFAEFKATKCSRCGSTVGANARVDDRGYRYCSDACYYAVHIPKPALNRKPDPSPAPLKLGESTLLVGKSSGGYYFECGRCAYCGQAIPNTSYVEFQFCGYSCRKRAMKPFLSDGYDAPYTDDYKYQKYDEALDELVALSHEEYEEEGLRKLSGKSYEDMIDTLRHKNVDIQANVEQRQIDYEHDALREFVRRWEAQRQYVLNREDEKFRLKEEEELQKQRKKEAAAAAERTAFEEAIKPRPIPDEPYRSEHTFILGPSGSGKTTLLQKIVLDDLAKPDPPAMVIIDPKGFMVERISKLSLFDPYNGRLKDRLIIVDPTHDPAPALNMFDPASQWSRMWSDQIRMQVENQIIGMFGYIFSASGFKLTEKQQIDFAYVVRLMYAIPNATVHTLLDILDDPAKNLDTFSFKPFVERLDEISRRFFRNEFFTEFKESKGQIKARLYMVLQHPSLNAALSAPKRKIDLIHCLHEKKIVLINTNANLLGERASAFLGRYFIASTLNAAFARFAFPRDERGQWPFASLVIDEFQEYADEFKTPHMLRLAREYNLGVTMATQNLHDDPFNDGLRNSISTNTTIKYASSPEGIDLSYVARDLRCDPEFLRQQTKTSAEARFACFVRGFTEHPMAISNPFGAIQREPQMSAEAYQALIRMNAERLSASPETHKPADAADLDAAIGVLAEGETGILSRLAEPPNPSGTRKKLW